MVRVVTLVGATIVFIAILTHDTRKVSPYLHYVFVSSLGASQDS